MTRNPIIIKIAVLFFAINASAVVMPGADTRNAYKFKKDYEDAFKTRQNRIASQKFKFEIKAISETDNAGTYVDDFQLAERRRRDEKQNNDTLIGLLPRSTPPGNITISTGDIRIETGSGSSAATDGCSCGDCHEHSGTDGSHHHSQIGESH